MVLKENRVDEDEFRRRLVDGRPVDQWSVSDDTDLYLYGFGDFEWKRLKTSVCETCGYNERSMTFSPFRRAHE